MSVEPFGSFPSAKLVSEEFMCDREYCQSSQDCWTRGTCLRRHSRTDFKGERRIVDAEAIRRKVLSDPECRSCGLAASDGHHIVFRSHGGDDVEDNIAPLCHDCHMALHFQAGAAVDEIKENIGASLTEGEVAYVLGKLGEIEGRGFLLTTYRLEVALS